MNILKKANILLLLFFICFCKFLNAKVETTYHPLDVDEHWSKRSVSEHTGKNRFYYRPDRFEFMELHVQDAEQIQLRGVLSEKASSIDVTIKIGKVEKKYTMKTMSHDDIYYYLEPLQIDIPKGQKSFFIKTRNPNAYFRHFEVKHREMKPKVYAIEPLEFWKSHQLISETSNSVYYSGNIDNLLSYKAPIDCYLHFYIRSIKDGRKSVTVDILKNGELIQTTILSNITSSDYKAGNLAVTAGKKIELSEVKHGDVISIIPRTEHEVLTRFYVTTKELF
jgi:hypothetical protein